MDVAHIGCWLQDEACEVNVLRVVRFLRVWQKLLMWLDGCKIGLTVESEEGEVPHLRWSQAPPLPWRRPGSADNPETVHPKVNLPEFVGSELLQCLRNSISEMV